MEEVLGKENIKKLIELGAMKTRFEGPERVTVYETEGVRFPTHLVPPYTIDAMGTWEARPDDVFGPVIRQGRNNVDSRNCFSNLQ